MRTDETNDGRSANESPTAPPPPSAAPRRRRGPDRRSADGSVSPRRAAANRANAERSTGPRTERGKRICRLNALQHGLAAQTSLLPGEDDVALARLTAEFEVDHGCGTAAERAVAGRMVSVVWKLRRLARAEEHAADKLQTSHAYAWGARRTRLGIGLPADGFGFDGPDPMPLPSDAPQIVAEEMERPGGPGGFERLMLWDVRLGGELMAASRQLANLRRALGTAHEEAGGGCGAALEGLAVAGDEDEVEVEDEDEAEDEVEEDGEDEGVEDDDFGDEESVEEEKSVGDDGEGEEAGPVVGGSSGEDGVGSFRPAEAAHLPDRPLTLALSPEYEGEGTGGGAAVGGDARVAKATADDTAAVPAVPAVPADLADLAVPATPAFAAVAAIPAVPALPAAAAAPAATFAVPDQTHCPPRPGPATVWDRGRAGW